MRKNQTLTDHGSRITDHASRNTDHASPVTVLYVHHRPELGGAPTSLYQLLRAVDRKRFRPVVLCPGGEAAELFRSAGVPVYPAPMSTFSHVVTCTYHGLRWGMLARELASAIPHARAIARRVRLERAALVHLNEGNLLLAALVARRCGARVVWHFRGMLADGHAGLRRRLVRACLAQWGDRIIAIDGGVAGPLAGLPNLRVVHNSVDLDAFGKAAGAAVRRELGIPLSAPVAGMVGRVRADEGSLDFLRAAALFQEGVGSGVKGVGDYSPDPTPLHTLRRSAPVPTPFFVLVGGGTRPPAFFHTPKGRLLVAAGIIRDELADAQALAKKLHLTNVRFVPFRRDVAAVYAALDVVVTGGAAGIGRQALEAAAAGRPIVAASRRPVPDLAAEGETGYVVAPGDVPALAERLEALFRDPARRAAMGAAARRLAEERFDPTANADRIMAIYEEVLGVGC